MHLRIFLRLYRRLWKRRYTKKEYLRNASQIWMIIHGFLSIWTENFQGFRNRTNCHFWGKTPCSGMTLNQKIMQVYYQSSENMQGWDRNIKVLINTKNRIMKFPLFMIPIGSQFCITKCDSILNRSIKKTLKQVQAYASFEKCYILIIVFQSAIREFLRCE